MPIKAVDDFPTISLMECGNADKNNRSYGCPTETFQRIVGSRSVCLARKPNFTPILPPSNVNIGFLSIKDQNLPT
jgi:hypothetical protein